MAKFEVGKDEWVNSNSRSHWVVQYNCLDGRDWFTIAGREERFSLKAGTKILLKIYSTRSLTYQTKKFRDTTILGGDKAFRLYNLKTKEEIFPEIFQVDHFYDPPKSSTKDMFTRTTWTKV